jgi:LPXTG-site transpeptidase (sortase) family protein
MEPNGTYVSESAKQHGELSTAYISVVARAEMTTSSIYIGRLTETVQAQRARRWPWVAALATGLVVLAAATGGALARPGGVVSFWAGQPPAAAQLLPLPARGVSPPTRLAIPRIGVETSLESLDLDDKGEITPPRDYARAGWYVRGVVPGQPGPAVIAGHVDSVTGPAIFFRLRELKPGDTVRVYAGDRLSTFRVTRVRTFAKTKFPTELVYGSTPLAELRLITCGGPFDAARMSYQDNVVVFATLVR